MEHYYGSVQANVEKAPYISNETLENSNGPNILVKKRKEKAKNTSC